MKICLEKTCVGFFFFFSEVLPFNSFSKKKETPAETVLFVFMS